MVSIGSESSVCLGCQYVKCLFTADEAVNLVQYEPTSQRSSLLSIDSDTEEALRISSMSVSAAVFLLASISETVFEVHLTLLDSNTQKINSYMMCELFNREKGRFLGRSSLTLAELLLAVQ